MSARRQGPSSAQPRAKGTQDPQKAPRDLPTSQGILPASVPAHFSVSGRCCGLDEVGRGALAGPLVAAAVILPDDIAERLGALSRFLRDSKTVPRARREELAAAIREYGVAVAVAEITADAINARGIGWANGEAFRQLIERIEAEDYVVDGRVRPPVPSERAGRVRCLVKADAQVPAVSAASLVAKVHRDAIMADLAALHPEYRWDVNAGYGTRAHLTALRAHGPTPHHRTLFIRNALAVAEAESAALSAIQQALIDESTS